MDDLKVKQDLFLLSKLEEEYNELSDKCNKLYTYIYSLDFITKVPSCDERCLMQEQHKRMESYRTNLYQRIDFYRCRVKTACGYDVLVPWSEVAKQLQKNGILLSPQEATQKLFNLFFKAKNMVYAPSEKCAKCGGDLLYGMGAKDGDETICFNCANQITNEELQQALDEYRAACTHHCGQDATCQVDDGSAVVQDPNESQPAEVLRTKEDVEKKLGIHIHEGNAPKGQCGCMDMKSLLDMQVIGVGNGKCEGCPQDHYGTPCVKVELVGGYYICLAPLHNSIVTE